MGALACELRDTVRWGLMQTNSEKFCRQPVLRLLPACHYEKLLLLFLCTGPNINICILSSDCCHIFGWEVFFEGGPTLSLPWVDCFPNPLVSSQMGTLSIQWSARRGFVKCLSNIGPTLKSSKMQADFRSDHLGHMKEIAEGTKDLEVESFNKATSSSTVPPLLQL